MNKFFITFILIPLTVVLQAQTLPSKEAIVDAVNQANMKWQSTQSLYSRSFWDNAAYHTGNMAAYNLTGLNQYKKYSTGWAEYNQWMGAKSDNPEEWLYNYGESDRYVLFGDWQICFQTYIDLYQLGDSATNHYMIERALEVMEYQMSTANSDYWWWVDALYMVMPVMTKLYKVTGNQLYLDKLDEYFNYSKSIMYDEEVGLFYRDVAYVYPNHTTALGLKDFWSRGDGWLFAGLSKIIPDLPDNYPADTSYKDKFIEMYLTMADTLQGLQQEEGYWTRSLMDPDQAPGYETSGTAFYTYGFAWGINYGLLDSTEYIPVVQKGWDYLHTIALQEDGTVGYVQPIGANAAPGIYVDENSTSNFGVGAFLLAGCEVIHLADGEYPQTSTFYMDSVKVLGDNHLRVYFNDSIDQASLQVTDFKINDIYIESVVTTEDKTAIDITTIGMELGNYQINVIDTLLNIKGGVVEINDWEIFYYGKQEGVEASSFESGSTNYPENTLDGDFDTRWSSQGVSEWIAYELGAVKQVRSVDIAFYQGDTRISYFDIEVSTDGTNYTQVYSGQSSGTDNGYENFEFDDVYAKYVKIIAKGNNSNDWNSYSEVNINVLSYPLELESLSVTAGNFHQEFEVGTTVFNVIFPVGTTEVTVNAVATALDSALVTGIGEITIDTSGTLPVTVTYKGVMTAEYLIHYLVDVECTLTHAYTFNDGTANDSVGTADGTIIGGSISNGVYTASAQGDYIEFSGENISINKYPSLTVEAYVIAGGNENFGNTMLTYFGDQSNAFGVDYFYTSLANNNSSRAGISCGNYNRPWDAESKIQIPRIDDGSDHHVVATINEDSIAFYIDGINRGKLELASYNSIQEIGNAMVYLCKGGYSGDATWIGSIYEFNIYKGIMDEEKIVTRSLNFPVEPTSTLLDDKTNDEVIIYPMVSSDGQFTLKSNTTSSVKLSVYSITGKLVKQISVNSGELEFDIPQSGIYIANVKSDDAIKVFKLLKK